MSVAEMKHLTRGYYYAGKAAGFLLGVWLAWHYIIYPMIPHHRRSKQSEAKINLGAIFTSQTAYFGEHRTYAAGPDCFKLIGWRPEGDTLYSYYCGEDVIPCTKPGCTSGAGKSLLPAPPSASETGFTIYAVGNVDRNTSDCDVWSMNDAKALKNDVNDIAN